MYSDFNTVYDYLIRVIGSCNKNFCLWRYRPNPKWQNTSNHLRNKRVPCLPILNRGPLPNHLIEEKETKIRLMKIETILN